MMMIWSLLQLLWAALYHRGYLHINNILQCGNILSCDLSSRQLRVRSEVNLYFYYRLPKLLRDYKIMIIIDRSGAVWLFLVCGIFLVVTDGQCPVVVSGARGHNFSQGWAGLSRADWRSVSTRGCFNKVTPHSWPDIYLTQQEFIM